MQKGSTLGAEFNQINKMKTKKSSNRRTLSKIQTNELLKKYSASIQFGDDNEDDSSFDPHSASKRASIAKVYDAEKIKTARRKQVISPIITSRKKTAVHSIETERKKNKSQEKRPASQAKNENVKVAIRVRPLLETEATSEETVKVDPNTEKIRVQTGSMTMECQFDHTFDSYSTQSDVYNFVRPAIQVVTQGISITVFAYGQTGTGKTHTMLGESFEESNEMDSNPESWGIIPRAVDDLFKSIQNNLGKNCQGLVSCSYMQIYNDKIYDLLTDHKLQKPLIMREKSSSTMDCNSVYVLGLSNVSVRSISNVLDLLKIGQQNRAVRGTEYNTRSSRSHAILQLTITIEDSTPNTGIVTRKSKLNLVDLAGSEKWNTFIEMGNRRADELKNINTSLSALGNCIAALTEMGRKHIPYRDSSLTRLLQDSLGGNTRTLVIATICSTKQAADESVRTLQFADRAKRVMQRVKANESLDGTSTLNKAKEEISLLRKELGRLKRAVENSTNSREQSSLEEIVKNFEKDIHEREGKIDDLTAQNAQYKKLLQDGGEKISNLQNEIIKLQSQLSKDQHNGRQSSNSCFNFKQRNDYEYDKKIQQQLDKKEKDYPYPPHEEEDVEENEEDEKEEERNDEDEEYASDLEKNGFDNTLENVLKQNHSKEIHSLNRLDTPDSIISSSSSMMDKPQSALSYQSQESNHEFSSYQNTNLTDVQLNYILPLQDVQASLTEAAFDIFPESNKKQLQNSKKKNYSHQDKKEQEDYLEEEAEEDLEEEAEDLEEEQEAEDFEQEQEQEHEQEQEKIAEKDEILSARSYVLESFSPSSVIKIESKSNIKNLIHSDKQKDDEEERKRAFTLQVERENILMKNTKKSDILYIDNEIRQIIPSKIINKEIVEEYDNHIKKKQQLNDKRKEEDLFQQGLETFDNSIQEIQQENNRINLEKTSFPNIHSTKQNNNFSSNVSLSSSSLFNKYSSISSPLPPMKSSLSSSNIQLTCSKHSLLGCILCQSSDRKEILSSSSSSSSSLPRSSSSSSLLSSFSTPSSSSSSSSSSTTTERCTSHNLVKCILCFHKLNHKESESESLEKISFDQEECNKFMLSSKKNNEKCDKHNLMNCILCSSYQNTSNSSLSFIKNNNLNSISLGKKDENIMKKKQIITFNKINSCYHSPSMIQRSRDEDRNTLLTLKTNVNLSPNNNQEEERKYY